MWFSEKPKLSRGEVRQRFIDEIDAATNRAIDARMISALDMASIFDSYAEQCRTRFACTAAIL